MSTFAARSWLYDDVCSVLDKHRVGLYSASSQKQQSICGRITQLGHIILILSCVISKEAANILLNPMILSTWNNQDNHYITESVVASVYLFIKHHKWTRIVVLLCLFQWLSEYYMWKAPFIHQTCIHIYSSGSDMCPHLFIRLRHVSTFIHQAPTCIHIYSSGSDMYPHLFIRLRHVSTFIHQAPTCVHIYYFCCIWFLFSTLFIHTC
jgi:hypothetical protein